MSEAKTGDTVRIQYTGRFPDGTQFDASTQEEPLEFTLGEGNIIVGLEREIVGMTVGEKSTITVAAEDAYGPHSEEAVRSVPRDSMPKDIELVIGTQLQATTAEGHQVPLTVVSIDESEVTLDANHPLAGKELIFDIELVEIL